MDSDDHNNESEFIINQTDGLNLNNVPLHNDNSEVTSIEHLENGNLPLNGSAAPNTIIIVTNIVEPVFTSTDAKIEFESLFLQYDPEAQFQYLRCFRRARVVFTSTEKATLAHSILNNTQLLGQAFRCYFAQPITLSSDLTSGRQHLEPPPADKQFLISPPSSPPVGWEVITERQPAVNYDLIAAMAKLGPGESYELHSGNETQPSIVVHVCEDPIGFENRPPKIQQTRCPDRKP